MAVELRVPNLPESVAEAQVGEWLKREGDAVQGDEIVVTLETDKTVLEVPAPQAGTLTRIVIPPGELVKAGTVLGVIEAGVGAPRKPDGSAAPARTEAAPAAAAAPGNGRQRSGDAVVMPAAQRLMAQHNVPAGAVRGTGPEGRVLKEDVLDFLEAHPNPSPTAAASAPSAPPATRGAALPTPPASSDGRQEEVVTMSMLRKRVAARLVEAQQTAALLTTFNEVDMGAVMDLRNHYKDAFQQRYGIKLGFMSFFVKAVVDGLKQFPALNAEIRGDKIVYRNYYDIGVAIGTERGLVVPVLRSAEHLSFHEIELRIADFAERAKKSKLEVHELQGGTFTITNGGVYGSLLSTPIVNPPQSGILGMHAIQDRPVARNNQVVIRPMMYVALTYDHRLVDGRESVTFLRRVKEAIEEPARMLLEV